MLTPDEIDDVLYFVRANDAPELQQSVSELASKYQCTNSAILEGCIDQASGNTVLHFASANGLAELLPKLLLQLEASDSKPSLINRGNSQGNTALHWAAYNGHLDIVKLLIAAGADMWQKNSSGHLAMFEAERADKSEVVQYLLQIGGEKVEEGGAEGQASAEDVADVQNAEASSSTHPGRTSDGDIEMSQATND